MSFYREGQKVSGGTKKRHSQINHMKTKMDRISYYKFRPTFTLKGTTQMNSTNYYYIEYLLISIAVATGALKCYQGISEGGFIEYRCPEKNMKCMEFQELGEVAKLCGHGCVKLWESEQSNQPCSECDTDLCNIKTDNSTIKCIVGDTDHNFRKAICHNFGPYPNRKCITITSGTFISKACISGGCEEGRKIYQIKAKRNASIPKMQNCKECSNGDYCNDDNAHAHGEF